MRLRHPRVPSFEFIGNLGRFCDRRKDDSLDRVQNVQEKSGVDRASQIYRKAKKFHSIRLVLKTFEETEAGRATGSGGGGGSVMLLVTTVTVSVTSTHSTSMCNKLHISSHTSQVRPVACIM